MAKSLPVSTREELLNRVLRQKIPVAQACQELGISRFTYYKWLKRYKSGKGLKDKPRKVERFWRQATPQQEELVLKVVIENPTLSKYKIAERLKEITGQPVLGPHGIYNILRRRNLTLPEARLAYAQAMAPAVKPVTWLDRLNLVWETFVPAIAPAPPPQFREIAKAFLASFTSSSIFSFLFLFWLQMISRHPFQTQLGLIFASISLSCGTFFFLYSMKYYFTLAVVLSFSKEAGEGGGYAIGLNGRFNGNGSAGWLRRIFGIPLRGPTRQFGGSGPPQVPAGGLQPSLEHIKLERYPFISVHLPFYNEKKVAERILSACTSFDYPAFEVIVVDDSTDETVKILEKWKSHPRVKIIHRSTREGFKGGALRQALSVCDPRTEFVVVFDADFIPYPDTLELFMKYFQANGLDLSRQKYTSEVSRRRNTTSEVNGSNLAAVAGYQWHVLNKSENWITRGIRSEYAGSYVIERPGQEILGAMKLIHGSVYCIRADLLKKFGWGTSITEDFQLTLKLYEKGYKVIYTPYVQAPAECVSTLKRLIRQRMRWAEGHSHNIRKMFLRLLFGSFQRSDLPRGRTSPGKVWAPSPLSPMEKLEFIYLSPYYLQAFFFLIGTFSWLMAETVFRARLPFWTSVWGWSLVLTNFFSLPLVNAVGLFLEESEEKDYLGILSFVALSYLLVPFQAYASVKGFLEKEEGPWFRTPKTGLITDIFTRGKFYRWISGILPGRQPAPALEGLGSRVQGLVEKRLYPSGYTLNPYLALATANSRFDKFSISRKRTKWIGRISLVVLLILSTLLLSLAPVAPYFIKPKETQAKGFGMLAGPQGNLTQTGKSIDGAYPDGSNLEELKPKEINPSTYAFKTLEGDVVEIGTEKHSPPQPYLKLDKWDGEVSLKVDIPFITEEKPTLVGDKIRYSTVNDQQTKNSNWWQKIISKFFPFARASTENQPKIDIEFYPRQPEEIVEKDDQGNEQRFTINEQGGVEFDTILYEKPNTNQIVFPIETKGLKFYYQPELTQKEKDEGAFQPENVIGSYAVYHESKSGDYTALGGKNYRAGKAFHIYRPKIKDASGKEIWGGLKIDDGSIGSPQGKGTIIITVDQNWLNNAVYPVTIDPRFGYETAGTAGSTALVFDQMGGSLFTSPSNAGTANSLTFYFRDAKGYGGNSKAVIVLHSNLNIIANGIGNAVFIDITANWYTSSFATPPSLSPNTEYVLMQVTSVPANSAFYYDSGDTNQGHIDTSNSYTSPTNPTDATHNNNKYSIYATYTAKIDTSTSSSPTAYSFQRKTWYDGTRLWSAFYSGTEIEFWYSADWGSNWTQNTSATISVSTNDFTIEADTADAFIAYTDGYDIKANEDTGTYPATNFAWGASPTTVYDGSSTTDEYDYPAISKDSNSKVWITATHLSGTDYLFKARQGTTANDISAWGTATTLDTSANSNKYGTIVSSGTGEVYAVWIDATTIEGKEYTSGTWAGSPTSIATGVTGLTNNMSAVSDSSGNVHLLYINSSDYAVYQEYTTSWQTAVTLDSTAGNDYPTISLNTSNNDLYALWIRSNTIYYKKGVSPYASANWDASATSWKSTGTNTYTTSNYSGAGMIYALWTEGTGSPYSVNWDYVIIPENLWLFLLLSPFMGRILKKLKKKNRV